MKKYEAETLNNQTFFFTYIPFFLFFFSEPSPPRFTVNPPPQMYVSAGSEVNMSCKAGSFPNPVVIWYKDGLPVPQKNTSGEMGMAQLTFKSATSNHQGEYWCEATNSHGRKRSSSTVLALTRGKLVFPLS